MVIAFWGTGPSPTDYAWVDPSFVDPWVDYAARNTYDYAYQGCGELAVQRRLRRPVRAGRFRHPATLAERSRTVHCGRHPAGPPRIVQEERDPRLWTTALVDT
jgi:hypothetical protein